MKKVTIACVLMALLTVPALAQKGGREPTPEELAKKRENAALDKSYNSAVRRMGNTATTKDTPGRSDPWADVRSVEAPPKR
jgi:hypothetical protein